LKESHSYTPEQVNEIIGGILNKLEDGIKILRIAPPGLSDGNTLALAISDDEIENLSETQAKIALVPFGASVENMSTIEVERPRLAMMKLIHLFYMLLWGFILPLWCMRAQNSVKMSA